MCVAQQGYEVSEGVRLNSILASLRSAPWIWNSCTVSVTRRIRKHQMFDADLQARAR